MNLSVEHVSIQQNSVVIQFELSGTRSICSSAKSIDATLETTTQRKASYALMGIGAGLVVAGGFLAAFALEEQVKARQFQSLQNSGEAQCGPAVDPDCVNCRSNKVPAENPPAPTEMV